MSSYPPGCTTAMVDAANHADDAELCEIRTPDGVESCNLDIDHEGEHQVLQYSATWRYNEDCKNPSCPNPSEENSGWPCDHDMPPGTWWCDHSAETVVMLRWPRAIPVGTSSEKNDV